MNTQFALNLQVSAWILPLFRTLPDLLSFPNFSPRVHHTFGFKTFYRFISAPLVYDVTSMIRKYNFKSHLHHQLLKRSDRSWSIPCGADDRVLTHEICPGRSPGLFAPVSQRPICCCCQSAAAAEHSVFAAPVLLFNTVLFSTSVIHNSHGRGIKYSAERWS